MRRNIFMIYLVVLMLFTFPIQIAYSEQIQGEEFSSICGGSSLNIRDSLILSTITLCIPGILENVDEYKQIRCEEVVCTYTSISNGVPANHCSKQAAYRECTQIYGEVFAIPPIFNIVQFVDQFKQSIATYLANPYIFYITAIRKWGKTCSGECDLYQYSGSGIILAVNDLAAAYQKIVGIFDQEFSPSRGPNYCDQVEEFKIREQIDKIMGVEE